MTTLDEIKTIKSKERGIELCRFVSVVGINKWLVCFLLFSIVFSFLTIIYRDDLLNAITFFIELFGDIWGVPEQKMQVFRKDLEIKIFPLFVSIISIFFIYNLAKTKEDDGKNILLNVAIILIIGVIIRLYLAFYFYGNYDMESYEIVVNIVLNKENVYANTHRYNYSPLWFIILSFLKKVSSIFSLVSFHFIVRSFLCIIDMFTVFALIGISSLCKLSGVRVAALYFLNPIVFLLTGYHGQFENLAVLFLIIGILIYMKYSLSYFGKFSLWYFATLSMLVKHNIVYQVLVVSNFIVKKDCYKALIFCASVFLFLLTFTPYLGQGMNGIVRNVFLYGSTSGAYGVSSLANLPILKYVFIISLLIFPFYLSEIVGENIIRQSLFGMLFFIVFTTGLGVQYFVLPIALGTLVVSRGFVIYSIFGTIFLLGSNVNLNLPFFHYVNINIVWLAAVYWFVAEYFELSLSLKRAKVFGG